MLSLALLALFGTIQARPPIVADVHVGGSGPYRFLVDTGAQSSVVDAALAEQLGLRAQYRVELVTGHGSTLVKAARIPGLRIGSRVLPETEVLFQDLSEPRRLDPSIRGVLGLNALRSFSFLMSSFRMDPEGTRPEGEVLPFELQDERIVVKARMGRETLALVLDSGASHMVLFRTPAAMANTPPVAANVSTLEGSRSVAPTTWTADLLFTGRLRLGQQPAAIVERPPSGIAGLLPASVFRKVFVDYDRRELVIVP